METPDPGGRPPVDFVIERQPDDVTCGPTCLQAVYAHYGDRVPLDLVTREVPQLEAGGTLAVYLGIHALRRGYKAAIYTCDLELFDPTWFGDEPSRSIADGLRMQAKVKRGEKLRTATAAYLEFLELGGDVRFREMDAELLRGYLRKDVPILTGLSATYLYGCAREREADEPGRYVYDDVAGVAVGHFVVVWHYDPEQRVAWVADPLHDNPISGEHVYPVRTQRLLGAILLGAATYDANILVLEPKPKRERRTT